MILIGRQCILSFCYFVFLWGFWCAIPFDYKYKTRFVPWPPVRYFTSTMPWFARTQITISSLVTASIYFIHIASVLHTPSQIIYRKVLKKLSRSMGFLHCPIVLKCLANILYFTDAFGSAKGMLVIHLFCYGWTSILLWSSCMAFWSISQKSKVRISVVPAWMQKAGFLKSFFFPNPYSWLAGF